VSVSIPIAVSKRKDEGRKVERKEGRKEGKKEGREGERNKESL
jgi:hypothetical protein